MSRLDSQIVFTLSMNYQRKSSFGISERTLSFARTAWKIQALNMSGRHAVLRSIIATISTVIFGSSALADTYPSHPIRMVVTYAAGGISDSLARTLAKRMSESMGQQVFVENRVGGSGITGSLMVAKASPDGYTVLFGANGPQAASVSLFSKMPYDPVDDLSQVALVGISGVVLVVAPNSPFNNLQDVINAARSHPGKLTFGSSGPGGTPHLAGEYLKSLALIDLTHIPYKGDAPSIVDVMGGQITMAFPGTGSAVALIRAGQVKALGVSSERRGSSLPNIPAFSETLPGYDIAGWFGLFLPAGAPQEIVNKLHLEVLEALKDPQIKKQFEKLGVDVPEPPLTPLEFKEFQKMDIVKLRKLIRQANVELN